MSLSGEPSPVDGASSVEELIAAVSGSQTLSLLGLSDANLEEALTDSSLFETLRITHELVVSLRDEGVLGIFLSMSEVEQSNFVRWIGATDDQEVRRGRTKTFVTALKESPLGDDSPG